MKLALLDDCEEMRFWLPLLREQSRHQIVAGADLSDETVRMLPGCEIVDRGERFLEMAHLDAVLLAGGRDRSLESAKQLATQGVPVIVLPHPHQGTAFLYELSLIRDSHHTRLFAWFPLRRHPLIVRFREFLGDDTIGVPIQWEIERSETPDTEPARVSLKICDRRMLSDVDLLRQLSGNYSRVTAIRSGFEGTSIAAQTVSLSGNSLPEAVWTIRSDSRSHWTLTVRGERGEASVSGDSACGLDQLLVGGERFGCSRDEVVASLAEELDEIEAGIERAASSSDWSELIRIAETVEATHQSVRRRRTIDLYFEVTSERSQFKTLMTALGCGVLMLTLVLVVVVMMIGQLLDPGPTVMKIARVLAFAPLFLFLALQTLIVLARPSQDEQEVSSPS
jgi:hypothetical protein